MSQNSNLEGQISQRIQQLNALKEKGINPFNDKFEVNCLIQNLPNDLTNIPEQNNRDLSKLYKIAGKVIQINSFGKAKFIVLRGDYDSLIQIFISKNDCLQAFELTNYISLGDYIGCSGDLFKTKQDKRALFCQELVFLTKAIRPLPGKLLQENNDITDVGELYKKRYIDFIQHPEKIEIFRKRARIINEIRTYLNMQGFLEVETPVLQSISGGANAKPFKTYHNALNEPMNLRIAPELYLKQLIISGIGQVYELGKNFRNEGIDKNHNPEFTALEVYQSYATFINMMMLTEKMLVSVILNSFKTLKIEYQGAQLDFNNFQKMTMHRAVQKYCPDVDISNISNTQVIELFEQHVEKNLIQPTFIFQYPIEVSPLARPNDDNPNVADRFELFVGGMELANGYSELANPIIQKNNFQQQVAKKNSGNEEAMDYDENYITAMEYGLPPTGGLGIGIDRLVKILLNCQSIKDVILFPVT